MSNVSMKVAALVLAAFALMLTTCGGVPTGSRPCDGPACARGSSSNVPPFAGFEPASHSSVRSAPITLDSVDGTALSLEQLDAETVVDGPLAFTELRLTFKNEEERQIEGRFRMALPGRASVSRFAMKIAGRWQEAEVVEKARGTEVYETFLHQKVDPALLEQGAGNELGARVFPIFAKSTVELVVGYSQELSDEDRTVLPLDGLAEVGRLDARIVRASAAEPVQRLRLAKQAPEDDLRVDDLGSEAGLRSGPLVMARVRPKIEAPPEPLRAALFLIDTSASRALDLDRQLELVRALAGHIASLQADASIAIGCFDQRTELAYAGRADGLTREHFERIRRRRALGASNLQGALQWARTTAREQRLSRVVLVSDGVPTAGDTSGNALRLAVRRLSEGGIERMDVVAFGGIRDDELLATLADADLARDGIVADGTAPPAMLWRKLNHATRSEMKVEVEGASWWYPRSLDSMQPGAEAFVFAQMRGGAQPHIVVDGQAQPAPELRQTERLLLERALNRAKIASLVERTRRDGNSPELQREIVELSTKARVLSPYTSLLVLEQEWHYQRFGIDRRALGDILTIRDGRIAVLERSQPQKPQAQGSLWGDAAGAGGLGLSGIGEGGGGGIPLGDLGTIGRGSSQASPTTSSGEGFGSGHGRLARAHQPQPPRVRMGATSVSGRLPPEVVQRIVRQNFGRFRGAYNAALRRNPRARGRVAMRFVIARDGSIASVDVASTEINDAQFLEDLRQAFASLSFPIPEGGVVTVVYPIHFTTENDTTTPAPQPEARRPNPRRAPLAPRMMPKRDSNKPAMANPHSGEFAAIQRDLREGRPAIERAARWQRRAPGDVLAFVALGEALEAAGQPQWAARAYGSIVDLFSARADLRRFAGGHLERVDLDSAIDTYRKARELRADQPSSHRLYAFALLKKKRYAEAFDALQQAFHSRDPLGRMQASAEVLRQDLGLIAAAWIAADPSKRETVDDKLLMAGASLDDRASLRFVLTWETDTNDVDLHIYDKSGHAFFGSPTLPSGGTLHADVTNGYGPELFTIEHPKSRAYRVQAHYYARGPMGYGMGKLQVIRHDGKGGLRFSERPFVVMNDDAYVDLGTFGN